MSGFLIANGMIVTMDPSRRIISDGAVAIDGRDIVDIGPADQLRTKHSDKSVIDASGKLVLPGLVDAHNHPFHSLSRGIVDEGEPTKRLYKVVYPYEAALTAEEVKIASLATFVEMIRNGTTTFNDPDGTHVDAMGEAAAEIGIRGILSRSTWDTFSDEWTVPDGVVETAEEALERAEDVVRRWHGAEGDRIRAWFSVRTLITASDRLARGVKELADKYGVAVHAHESASQFAGDLMTQAWGMRGIERYRRLGLLGPNLYLVHMGWVNDEELELVREHDVKVCHCPSTTMFGGQGNVANGMIPRMLERGVTMSLGTDAAAISRFLDMVRIMYIFVASHREMGVDRTWMNAYKALEMATIDGARACLWDDAIGSLEVGKRADIIVVDTDGPEWHPNPLGNPVANLVYSASGSSVNTVLIDGRVVMENRHLQTVDAGEIMKEADRASAAVLDRLGFTPRPKWPVV